MSTWLFYESNFRRIWRQKSSGFCVSPCSLLCDERLDFDPQSKVDDCSQHVQNVIQTVAAEGLHFGREFLQ